jgi:hypothetical protein
MYFAYLVWCAEHASMDHLSQDLVRLHVATRAINRPVSADRKIMDTVRFRKGEQDTQWAEPVVGAARRGAGEEGDCHKHNFMHEGAITLPAPAGQSIRAGTQAAALAKPVGVSSGSDAFQPVVKGG